MTSNVGPCRCLASRNMLFGLQPWVFSQLWNWPVDLLYTLKHPPTRPDHHCSMVAYCSLWVEVTCVCMCVLASKAVDCLLDSKWAKAKKGDEAVFTTRESVVDYCNRCLSLSLSLSRSPFLSLYLRCSLRPFLYLPFCLSPFRVPFSLSHPCLYLSVSLCVVELCKFTPSLSPV